eukprot:3290362-Pleurochrysis_carterae.AAC.1
MKRPRCFVRQRLPATHAFRDASEQHCMLHFVARGAVRYPYLRRQYELTLAHIEHQMASALALQSATEYRHWVCYFASAVLCIQLAPRKRSSHQTSNFYTILSQLSVELVTSRLLEPRSSHGVPATTPSSMRDEFLRVSKLVSALRPCSVEAVRAQPVSAASCPKGARARWTVLGTGAIWGGGVSARVEKSRQESIGLARYDGELIGKAVAAAMSVHAVALRVRAYSFAVCMHVASVL